MSILLENALDAVRRGIKVFPLVPKTKTPLTPNGVLGATDDIEKIRAWWTKSPKANIGTTGCVILDVDIGCETQAEVERFAAELQLQPTLMIRTGGRPGYRAQLYFTGQTDLTGPYKLLGISGEVRSQNMYGIFAPSIHPLTGKKYEIVIDLPMAPWPGISLGILPKPKEYPPVTVKQARENAIRLREEAATARQGTRHERIHACVYYAARAYLAGVWDGEDYITQQYIREKIYKAVAGRYKRGETNLENDIDRSWDRGMSHGPLDLIIHPHDLENLFFEKSKEEQELLALVLDGNFSRFESRDAARAYMEEKMEDVLTEKQKMRVLRYARLLEQQN